VADPWCVLLASREEPQCAGAPSGRNGAHSGPVSIEKNPFHAALSRAGMITAPDRIAAVVLAPVDRWRQSSLKGLSTRNLFVQPKYRGTAYEVLVSLLQLESRVSSAIPVLFLPVDHVVDDEEVMTNALITMTEWIADDPGPVYLLGAVPQGPHDQMGYIVPWHDAMLMPTGIYEFVEMPDVSQARRLINAGALWNTFIFGGNVASLIKLFQPAFDEIIGAFRAALRSDRPELDLGNLYDRLSPTDFSQDILVKRIDDLSVLRLLRCGWWPLKSPALTQRFGSRG
jgi:mannose-1-phosphate guanylyltransferase